MTSTPPPTAAAPKPAPPPPARPRRTLAETRRDVVRLAGLCAVLSLVAVLVGLIGVRQGWIAFGFATRVLVGLAVPALALLADAFGTLGLVLALMVKPRAGLVGALSAIALGAVIFAVWMAGQAGAVRTPPVHDVATDWTDPLTFSPKVLAARGDKANPVELAPAVPEGPSAGGFLGRPVAEVNRNTCPAAVPVVLTTSRADAYARLKAAVAAERMAILTDDPVTGRLEATVARGVWGVRDDLVGRVRPEGPGARVDLRSIARAGLNDGGVNCARLTRLHGRLAR